MATTTGSLARGSGVDGALATPEATIESSEAGVEEAPAWRRRVLPLTEFMAQSSKERKRQGIPVVLFAGETEDEYERAFVDTLTDEQRRKVDRQCLKILAQRKLFARRRKNWCKRPDAPHEFVLDASEVATCRVEKLPREALYVLKYEHKIEYTFQVRSGFFQRLKTLSRSELHALFGNVIAPIYMPLESGEEPQECEKRFATWLVETKKVALEDVVKHEDPLEERRCRIEFAAATGFF